MTADHMESQETQTKGDVQPRGRERLGIAIDRTGPYPLLIPSRSSSGSDWRVRLGMAPDPWHGSQSSSTRQIMDRVKGSEIG